MALATTKLGIAPQTVSACECKNCVDCPLEWLSVASDIAFISISHVSAGSEIKPIIAM
jgi:hypothetical protein